MNVTIYHNPGCSKSRQTLDLLRQQGVRPRIVEYLKTPPDAATLKDILTRLGIGPRDLMRDKEARAAGLADPDLGDDDLIAGMVANPIVIQRPIVVAGDKAALGRPPEDVLAIL
jgi:arsenate reductase (glutaredoxin)